MEKGCMYVYAEIKAEPRYGANPRNAVTFNKFEIITKKENRFGAE